MLAVIRVHQMLIKILKISIIFDLWLFYFLLMHLVMKRVIICYKLYLVWWMCKQGWDENVV